MVYEGFRGFDYNDNDSFETSKYWDGIKHPYINAWITVPQRSFLRWLMYGAPTLDLVSGNGNIGKEDIDDIEYTGWIERAAKEEPEYIDNIRDRRPAVAGCTWGDDKDINRHDGV